MNIIYALETKYWSVIFVCIRILNWQTWIWIFIQIYSWSWSLSTLQKLGWIIFICSQLCWCLGSVRSRCYCYRWSIGLTVLLLSRIGEYWYTVHLSFVLKILTVMVVNITSIFFFVCYKQRKITPKSLNFALENYKKNGIVLIFFFVL